MEKEYWQENFKLIGYCLVAWFVCSFGFGILLVDLFNLIRIGGYGLGVQSLFLLLSYLCMFVE